MLDDNELREAYTILELANTATKEEVEQRYLMLLKKSKSLGHTDTTAISRAYKLIIEHHRIRDIENYEVQHYAGSKSRKAIDHFWTAYKTHIIVSVIVVIVLAFGVNTYLDKRSERIAESKLPPIDLEVMFVGEFFLPDDSDLGASLLAHYPAWQRIKTFISYNPENPQDQYDIYAAQKNMINLITEKPDVYITDEFNFNVLVTQGVFMKLDTIATSISSDRNVSGQSEEDSEQHLYGIDVSDSPIWEQTDLAARKPALIAAIRIDSSRVDQALKFVQGLVASD